MNDENQKDRLLRNALRSNATFSGICGVLFLLTAPWLSGVIGSGDPLILRVVGISLLFFSLGLIVNAARSRISRPQAWAAVVLDVLWVFGSVLLIALHFLTTTGNWAVVVVADFVLIFAVLQALGLRKLART